MIDLLRITNLLIGRLQTFPVNDPIPHEMVVSLGKSTIHLKLKFK